MSVNPGMLGLELLITLICLVFGWFILMRLIWHWIKKKNYADRMRRN